MSKYQDLNKIRELCGGQILYIEFNDKEIDGGLTILYSKNAEVYRMILGFNELDMWVHKKEYVCKS